MRPWQIRFCRAMLNSFERSARIAAQILVGGACLLVVAGTIEGFFSPSDAPDWTKYLVGLTTGTLLYLYLLSSRPGQQSSHYTFEDVLGPAQNATALPVP